jgi:hypothetical protein
MVLPSASPMPAMIGTTTTTTRVQPLFNKIKE